MGVDVEEDEEYAIYCNGCIGWACTNVLFEDLAGAIGNHLDNYHLFD